MRPNAAASLLVVLTLALIDGNFALADTLQNTSGTSGATSATAAPHTGLNLDLSSTQATAALRSITSPLTIVVGGKSETILPGQSLTAAERVAAYQVLHGGQTLTIGADGAAVGGSLQIGQHFASHLASLTIPQSVTVLDKASTLNLTGNLTNSGTLSVIFSGPNQTIANITAQNIFNNQTGIISTISSQGAIASALALNLTAANSIVNAGTISSIGALNVTAPSIVNALPTGATGVAPLMQAAGNLNLTTATLTNGGLLASLGANVAIAALPALNQNRQTLVINNTGGTIQSLLGRIDVGAPNNVNTNLNLTGGDWLSKELNLNAGTGAITAYLGNVSGVLNSIAGSEHFTSDASTLTLGNNTINGDPTFYNTGNIALRGTMGAIENLAILAGGNITNGGFGANIVNNGHNVTLIAGASLLGQNGAQTSGPTIDGGTSGTNIDGGSGSGSNGFGLGTQVLVNFSSPTGGSILLSGVNINTTSAAGNGGNVLLVAEANGGTGGQVQIGSVNTSAPEGTAGSVTVIAGASPASPANTIQMSNINASGATGGAVNVYTQQPAAGSVTFNDRGSIISGAIVNSGSTLNNAGVIINSITTDGAANTGGSAGNISIIAGGNVTTGAISGNGGSGITGAAGTVPLQTGDAPAGASGTLPGSAGAAGSNGSSGIGGGAGGAGAPGPFGVDQAPGGAGGNGGAGGAGATGGAGGAGGAGATSGDGGPGGAGGQGGNGGLGASGGNGGAGGIGGSGTGNIGGAGGNGGAAGNGGTGASGSTGGTGGNAASLSIFSTGVVQTGAISLVGGNGGTGGAGGTGGNGGNGGSGGTHGTGTFGNGRAGNGGNGGNGGDGGSGGDGGLGGNGGIIAVTALSFSPASTSLAGGSGGSPGTGGSAGLGGLGGAAGFGSRGVAGTRGSAGSSGASGLVGSSGNAGSINFTLYVPPALPATTSISQPVVATVLSIAPQPQVAAPPTVTITLPQISRDSALVPTDLTRSTRTSPLASELQQAIENTVLSGQISMNGTQSIGVFSGSTFDSQALSTFAQQGISIGQGSAGNHVVLDQGIVLFAPSSNIVVTTKEGDVNVQAGAIALISEDGHDVAIFDFADNHSGDVTIAGANKVSLVPGQEVVLTRDKTASLAEINPAPAVALRRTSKFRFSNDIVGYISDFSLVSALRFGDLYSRLKSNAPVLDRILHSAAAINTVTAYRGPYAATKPTEQ